MNANEKKCLIEFAEKYLAQQEKVVSKLPTDICTEKLFRAALEYLSTPHAASRVPDGWKLVPVEPTFDMIRPWLSEREMSADGYGTMGHDYIETAKELLRESINAAPSKEDTNHG